MEQVEILIDFLFSRWRWLIHVLFWGFVLALYSIFFGRQNSNYIQTFFFTGLLMPVTIASTYFVNYFLVPRYLMTSKYALFFLYLVYTLTVSVFLEMVVMVLTFIFLAEFRIKEMAPASIDVFFLLTSLSMVIFFALAVKIILNWRSSREDYQRLMKEKLETELKFLKAQLNPHFLFNTLNNLYYLTTTKSDRAPQAVLQLSQMLDYVMHDTRQIHVALEAEWQQLQNYVALESLRYEERLQVTTACSTDRDGYVIAPMLLITLVENAFKHGVMKISGKSWIDVRLECSDGNICIVVRNSCSQEPSGNGIGLTNLRNQLAILYPSRHRLNVKTRNPEEYHVELTLASK